MSELYSVYVANRPDEKTVDLRIKVVHPDSMYIYDTPGFYMMLLQECTEKNNLLAQEVDYDSVTDGAWLKKYARGFIEKVEVLELENEQPAAAESDYDHPFWADSSKWLSGLVRVTMTHPGWAQHAEDGLQWESASYDPNSKYDKCAVITPSGGEVVLAEDPEDRTGFLPIPNYFFKETFPLPSPVYIPIYGEKAYVMGDKIQGKDITPEVRQQFLGVPAFFKGSWSEDLGVLVSPDTAFTISSGSYGSSGVEGNGLKWIAPAKFNHGKKRLNEGLNFNTILGWVDAHISEIKVDGKTATFKVFTFAPGQDLKFPTEANAMGFLCRSVTDQMDEITDSESKLGAFLESQKEERDVYFTSELYTKLAGGMIKNYQIRRMKKASHPDLDSLEHAELVAELAKEPWATWRITLEVSDPAWIEHLPAKGAYSYGFSWMEESEAWEEDDLVYVG